MRPAVAALAAACAFDSAAASIEVNVKDAAGAPLEDAVVFATLKGGTRPPARPAEIAQKDRQFVPGVSIVQAGASVRFPNRDPFRHHVYSYSPAKPFEIKLYVGTPADPVVFDKPGEVVLGCNIHDSMVGYVYVVDTPHFAKTNKDGRARIESLPAGEYELRVLHFGQASPPAPRALTLKGDDAVGAAYAVPLRPMPQRPPG